MKFTIREIEQSTIKMSDSLIQNTANTSSDISLALTITATCLVTLTIYYHVKVFSFWSSRGIKGPMPWPLLGTKIYYLFRPRIDVDAEMRQRYGKVYGLFDGYKPNLRVSDNELLKFVMIKNFSNFTDRNNQNIHSPNMKRWLFWSSGDHWSNQRALITPMFASSKMKSMFATMTTCMSRFLQEVGSRVKRPGDSESKKEAVFSKDVMMALALDVIASSFFSLKLDTYRDKSSDFFKRAFAFSHFDVPRLILWLLTPASIRKLVQLDLVTYPKYEFFDKLGQSMIEERRKNPTARKNDFIQALLEAKVPETKEESVYTEEDDMEAHYNDQISYQELERQHENQSNRVTFRKFDDLEIRSQMVFFFLAGFDTTSSSLSFCLYELAHKQQVQQEVYEELSANPDLLNKIDYSDLLSLKKLDAFVSETLRLYPPVLENNRLVTNKEGVTLPTSPPIHLPYGCEISNPSLDTQRDSDSWPEPLKFDMTRFYPENRDKLKTCSYLPFGVGPRHCAGMRFALMTIKLCLATTLLKYRVEIGPNSKEYPPKFNNHFFFLQLKNTDFKLIDRE